MMKGTSQMWWILALILIPLVVLVIAGMGESSLLEELKMVAKGLDQFLPDISIGTPELKAGEVSIPVEHQAAIDDLKKAMEVWMLVFIILAIILLVLVVSWYFFLAQSGESYLDKLLAWL